MYIVNFLQKPVYKILSGRKEFITKAFSTNQTPQILLLDAGYDGAHVFSMYYLLFSSGIVKHILSYKSVPLSRLKFYLNHR